MNDAEVSMFLEQAEKLKDTMDAKAETGLAISELENLRASLVNIDKGMPGDRVITWSIKVTEFVQPVKVTAGEALLLMECLISILGRRLGEIKTWIDRYSYDPDGKDALTRRLNVLEHLKSVFQEQIETVDKAAELGKGVSIVNKVCDGHRIVAER